MPKIRQPPFAPDGYRPASAPWVEVRTVERVGRGSLLALLVGISLIVGGSATSTAGPVVASASETASRVLDLAPERTAAAAGSVDTRTFESASLGRTMPYRIYLPPGYSEESTRYYPVVYLLHGMGGSDQQWQQVGIVAAADRLISSGAIAPVIIVMPEGERAYWVDHATDGERWGRYTAVDVVADVESHFRTLVGKQSRAIGGLSMGAHGAVQLALNYPGEFGAVGAHSLVLRRYGSAPSYFGTTAEFAKRDPMQIVATKGKSGCSFALWIDIGDKDPWAPLASDFNSELSSLGVPHQWHLWSGDHSGEYWSAHLDDYLRFYGAALTGHPARVGALL